MIETARLILREYAPGDRARLHALWGDPVVMAELGPVKTAQDSDAAIARHIGYREQGLGFWCVEQRSDGAMIGFCGLKPGAPDTPIEGEVEIGWMLGQPWWGQGLAFEAASASIAWGWANTSAARIVAITAAINLRSRRLMARLGMAHAVGGDFEHPLFAPGDRLRDTVIYAIARPGSSA